ncbi:hypothetical protein CBS101457_003431 [Exobasidium rhododendri]|nr:hypothetical protein CBS101457_003431 [Exobasidium rhododendri]
MAPAKTTKVALAATKRPSAADAKNHLSWAPPTLPIDILIHILSQYALLSPKCAVNALLISPSITSAVEESVYSTISLFSISGLTSFNDLLKERPELGRRIKSLWIAPCRLNSDLIPALAPPNASASSEALQNRVQSLSRSILRACRRLQHLALDGGFITPHAANGFGTACKPKTLLCVNPHSFLGHFSAPIFRTTVQRLEVVDQTLACEEVDEIRLMQGLRHFLWTSPRANSDVTRDVSVLLRILAPRAQDNDTDSNLLKAIMSSGSAPPNKTRQNQHLQTICTSTSQARAAALATSFKKVVENVEFGEEEEGELDDQAKLRKLAAMPPGYIDSGSANSNMLHKPTGVELQTRALSSLMLSLNILSLDSKGGAEGEAAGSDINHTSTPAVKDALDEDEDDDEVVDEWEALRDVVCQRRTGYSTSRLFAGLSSGHSSGLTSWGNSRPPSPPVHEDIDGGRALQRIWRRWKQQIDSGELDRFIT